MGRTRRPPAARSGGGAGPAQRFPDRGVYRGSRPATGDRPIGRPAPLPPFPLTHSPLDFREVCTGPFPAEVLKDEPGARVERIATPSRIVVRKTYLARPSLLWRSLGQRSRARREFENLRGLEDAGVSCVRPLAWTEQRSFGCVPTCVLLTEFRPSAPDLRHVLRNGCGLAERRALAEAYGRLVRTVHRAGYISTTLTPRNVLVESERSLVLCDQPAAIRFGDDVGLRWLAGVDIYDALFSPSRRAEWSRTDRFRGLLAYTGGDRRAAERLWRRLERRRPTWNRLLRGFARCLGRVGFGRVTGADRGER